LFVEEEDQPIEFKPGPEYGEYFLYDHLRTVMLNSGYQFGVGDGMELAIWMVLTSSRYGRLYRRKILVKRRCRCDMNVVFVPDDECFHYVVS
jgi:hypothetical protein